MQLHLDAAAAAARGHAVAKLPGPASPASEHGDVAAPPRHATGGDCRVQSTRGRHAQQGGVEGRYRPRAHNGHPDLRARRRHRRRRHRCTSRRGSQRSVLRQGGATTATSAGGCRRARAPAASRGGSGTLLHRRHCQRTTRRRRQWPTPRLARRQQLPQHSRGALHHLRAGLRDERSHGRVGVCGRGVRQRRSQGLQLRARHAEVVARGRGRRGGGGGRGRRRSRIFSGDGRGERPRRRGLRGEVSRQRVREGARAHVGAEVSERAAHGRAQLRVLPHELGRPARVQPQQVVRHEHLAVARGPRADADGGDAQQRLQRGRHLRGHLLQHDGEGAGALHGGAVQQQLQRGGLGAAREAVARHGGRRLGQQPDVRHHGDALGHDGRDLGRLAAPALELDAVRAALLHQPHRGAHRRVRARPRVAAERHVRHQERARRAARHPARVPHHVVERDADGRVGAVHHHAHAVAHEQHVHARRVGGGRHREVVRREHADGRARGVLGLQRAQRHARGGAAVEAGARSGARRRGQRLGGHGGAAREPAAAAAGAPGERPVRASPAADRPHSGDAKRRARSGRAPPATKRGEAPVHRGELFESAESGSMPLGAAQP